MFINMLNKVLQKCFYFHLNIWNISDVTNRPLSLDKMKIVGSFWHYHMLNLSIKEMQIFISEHTILWTVVLKSMEFIIHNKVITG